MAFCPSCEAEYQEDVTICPNCNTNLVDHLVDRTSTEDTIDVYICYDTQLAERVRDLLRASGLTPLLRDHSSAAFPTKVGTTSEYCIAVPTQETPHAKAKLREAIADGIIEADAGVVR